MPIFTPTYNLAAFVEGEPYSSVFDKSRFSDIDFQLEFLSRIPGNGKISGWSVTDATAGGTIQVQIGFGFGIVDKFVAHTFSDILVELEDDSVSYVYLQRKPRLIGYNGPFSSPVSVSWTDAVAPAVPAGLALSDITYDSIYVDWNDNTEADLSYYSLERSSDGGVTWTVISLPTVSNYSDTGLSDNTSYRYRVSAVDASGNSSVASAEATDSTLADSTPATPPNYFIGFSGDGQISLVWGEYGNPSPATITLKIWELDDEYDTIGSAVSYGVASAVHSYVIDGLTNGQNYLIGLYPVDEYGVESERVTTTVSPNRSVGPADVTDISISYTQSATNPLYVSTNLSFLEGIDPYRSIADKYAITIIENGNRESDFIYTYEDISNIVLNSFEINGTAYPFLERTDYIFKIQAVDESGDFSSGTISRIFVGAINPPSSVADISAIYDGNGLFFSWLNKTSDLSYNSVTIEDRNLSTEVEATLVSDYDNGVSHNYSLNFASLDDNHKYTIKITSYDSYGNSSPESEYAYTIDALDYRFIGRTSTSSEPPGVNVTYAFSGDSRILVTWKPIAGVDIAYYKIWRASFRRDTAYVAGDFVLLETFPESINSFVDYSVTNGSRYAYRVTIVDAFGNESVAIGDVPYVSHLTVNTLGIKGRSGLHGPTSVFATNAVGFDVNVNWSAVDGEFDCYEIYYAPLNLSSWEKVDTVANDVLVYTHTDALVDGDGTYYYMVRAARDEARGVAETSSSVPVSSIILAKVTTSGGAVTTIEDLSDNLSQMYSYIGDLLDTQLNNHKHTYSQSYDHRIDLSSSITVSDWATEDQQKYTTTDPLYGNDSSGDKVYASYYIVKVDGVETSIAYNVDPDNGEILFDQSTGSNRLSVMCVGISDVTNILPKERLQSFVAALSMSGKLYEETLPEIPHDGRREPLIPLQLPTYTLNDYTYEIYQNVFSPSLVKIGASLTFYDFINTDVGIVAATSMGLYLSTTSGRSWSLLRNTYSPVHKFYYDPSTDRYFALSSNFVYISDDGIGWSKTIGLENVSIVRDAAGDGTNVYVSTDIGVFVLSDDSFGDLLTWERVSLYSGKTSDTYAIFYDSTNSKLLVSTELGLFESFDGGATWSYTDEIEEMFPMWQMFEQNNYIFAISDEGIWRKHNSSTNFSQVASFAHNAVRKAVIYENRMFITTSDGLFVSNADQSVYLSIDLQFETDDLYQIQISTKPTAIFGLASINGSLFMGSDNGIFIAEDLDTIYQLYSHVGLIPTFYVDKEEQFIGVYYSVDNDIFYFDRKVEINLSVTVANQYSVFKAENGSWIGQNYNPDINVYNQDGFIAYLVNGTYPTSSFSAVSFDTFSEEDSNAAVANSYISQYNVSLSEMQAIAGGVVSDPDGTLMRQAASDCERLYQQVYSQLFGDIRFGSLITHESRTYLVVEDVMYLNSIASTLLANYEIVEELPAFTFTSLLDENISSNASNGIFDFGDNVYGKYDSLVVVIPGTGFFNSGSYSHRQVQNTLEKYNSGLDSYNLAVVDHCNTLKTGLYIDGELNESSSYKYQSNYWLPSDTGWYNVLDSTIDYSEKIDCANIGVDAIGYPTAVLYDSVVSKVFVGHKSGMVSIDVNTLDVSNVVFNDGSEEYVNDIHYFDGRIYVVTNQRLYYSDDDGVTWSEIGTYGLTGLFRRISSYHNQMVFATSDGIFYKYKDIENWSLVESSATAVTQFVVDNGIFALNNSTYVYYSVNGRNWTDKGHFGTSNVFGISQITFIRDLAFMATSNGLRHDSGTMYADDLDSSIVDLEGDVDVSSDLKINAVATNDDEDYYIAGGENGKYYEWDNITGIITSSDSGLNEIYKILRVGSDFWLFGNGTLRVYSLTFPINISTGVPL